uniref:Aldehyde dehydrogenase domain-containing protein n=1 Tax=Alexandrium catenella TaxID=2925 RepID=A0A7S1R777_ALECA|mmetsp:Transcript_46246/g.124210  ORF Transcript_46246/g.124210 Transcript_46246/m.124210 type:complete len:508 (+) Transcript_46246:29-1552(+)
MASRVQPLEKLSAGDRILVGGDHYVSVTAEIAERFQAGDAVLVVEGTGELLHLPAAERRATGEAVARAQDAFSKMGSVTDTQISAFFERFASLLEDESAWSKILEANVKDVEAARAKGRSTTRLVATDKLRRGMIDGLRGWINATSRRGAVLETVQHTGWSVDLVGAALGVVGFVFEGRPNVLADATGVLRGGNTVVFRIGSDALGTARAIMEHALDVALAGAGLPPGAVALIDSASHASGWALVSDKRLALAVARGSGPAVATLGALAKQAGVPASLHGTGGAWLYASAAADPEKLAAAVEGSLDRKVCNTLNVCCVSRKRAGELLPVVLSAVAKAAKKGGKLPEGAFKLHVVEGDEAHVPADLRERKVAVHRADGEHEEAQVELLKEAKLGHEWEWEETPELSLKVVDSADHAAELFNRHSPQFVVSCLSEDAEEAERFYGLVNAPFFGNGFTRWVDGQYSLSRPELGLSNWENGRLFGRGGVLSGDSVLTVRTRARQTDPALKR